jgi:hypothetical protein
MTFGALESGTSTNTVRIPSVVVLGADALLSALPATPIQLAHACALIGYQSVVPASWGDELIASASLRALREHGQLPAIQCSCPFVAHRLLAVGTDLRPFLVSLVAPPVVLARYLRALHAPRKLRITYVGRCPSASDESIDARLTPEELLAIIADRQIVLEDQPDFFDSVLPPDRRRYRSQPGGLPTPDMLWSSTANGTGARSLVELYGDELPVELAQHLLAGKPVLIDVAPRLGCVCAGAAIGVEPMHARPRVVELEPPRASHPVLDERVIAEASLSLPASPRSAIDVISPPSSATSSFSGEGTVPNEASARGSAEVGQASRDARPETDSPSPIHPPVVGRRSSPSRGMRPVSGGLPTARDADGRQLPRSYVARRRSPTRPSPRASTDAEAPISSSAEQPDDREPPSTPTRQSPETVEASPIESPRDGAAPPAAPELPPTAPRLAMSPPLATMGVEVAESVAPLRVPTTRPVDDERDTAGRFAERPVALPVTRLSDGRPREETPPQAAGDRPVMQLLTLGLLISMIVLVSAAVGVLVGRWMTQR